MKAYHGCSITNAARLLDALKNSRVERLYVTESQVLAARYANAQACGEVKSDFEFPIDGTAILEFEVSDALQWFRRSADHWNLDLSEATINPQFCHLTAIAYRDDYSMRAFTNPKCAWWLDEPNSNASALKALMSARKVSE